MSKQQAERLKLAGNLEYQKKNYQKALQYYQESVQYDPQNPILYTNQAIARIRIKDYHNAKMDCQKALKLDSKSYKAHFYTAISEFHLKNYADSEKSFTKSLALTKDQVVPLKIRQCLLVCRKKKFLVEDQLKKQVKREILDHILKMDNHYQPREHKDQDEKFLKRYQIESFFQTNQEDLIVPEMFQCPITMEIMIDPVITTSGISYEKMAIYEHLEKNGNFDPMTRKQCKQSELVPNVNLKNFIEMYLEKHPWAYPLDEMEF